MRASGGVAVVAGGGWWWCWRLRLVLVAGVGVNVAVGGGCWWCSVVGTGVASVEVSTLQLMMCMSPERLPPVGSATATGKSVAAVMGLAAKSKQAVGHTVVTSMDRSVHGGTEGLVGRPARVSQGKPMCW